MRDGGDMNTITRTHATAVSAVMVAALALSGCASAAAPDRSEKNVTVEQDASVERIPLEVVKARNLLVNDNDPRGLHGASAAQQAAAAVPSVSKSTSPVNDNDPRGLHGLPKPGKATSATPPPTAELSEPHGLRSDPSITD